MEPSTSTMYVQDGLPMDPSISSPPAKKMKIAQKENTSNGSAGFGAKKTSTKKQAAGKKAAAGPGGDADSSWEPATKKTPKAKKPAAKKAVLKETNPTPGTSTGGATKKRTPKAKEPKPTCVKTCRPGKNSGCTIRGRGKPASNISCFEVHRRLKALGVNGHTASRCAKAAIMKGLIELKGEDKSELDRVLHSEEGECGHEIEVTLRALLEQPDYAGTDYEDGCQEATVSCQDEDCCEGNTYVTGVCQGKFQLDCGKFHNHCKDCPGFGSCIFDYRNEHCKKCGKHYFAGNMGYPCPCKERRGGSSKNKFNDCSVM